jgi:16S rRNA processing protein RimM
MNPGSGWLRAGGVGKPHGLDGSFYVTEPKPQLLDAGRGVVLRGASARIAARKGSDGRPIIRLEGISARADAEALRGEQLLVARDDAPELDDDEWWEEDLEGCSVRAGEETIGTVRRLVAMPSCEVLEVDRGTEASDLLVPLVRDAVVSVDVTAKEIQVDLAFLGEEGA